MGIGNFFDVTPARVPVPYRMRPWIGNVVARHPDGGQIRTVYMAADGDRWDVEVSDDAGTTRMIAQSVVYWPGETKEKIAAEARALGMSAALSWLASHAQHRVFDMDELMAYTIPPWLVANFAGDAEP